MQIEVCGFTADDVYVAASESIFKLPVRKLSQLAAGSNILNGTVFENQKGPKFLKEIYQKCKVLGLNFPGFSTVSHETVELRPGSQIWNKVLIDCY